MTHFDMQPNILTLQLNYNLGAIVFKSADELKSFISWAIEKRITRVKVDNIEVDISPLAFLPEEEAIKVTTPGRELSSEPDVEPKNDPDLFWSVSN